jgi:hypothetical protein
VLVDLLTEEQLADSGRHLLGAFWDIRRRRHSATPRFQQPSKSHHRVYRFALTVRRLAMSNRPRPLSFPASSRSSKAQSASIPRAHCRISPDTMHALHHLSLPGPGAQQRPHPMMYFLDTSPSLPGFVMAQRVCLQLRSATQTGLVLSSISEPRTRALQA